MAFKRAYTFDDICLIPHFSDLTSRLEPDTSTWLTKDIKIDIPIINSPMDSVIGYQLAEVLLGLGTIPIFNRFKDFEEYETLYKKYNNKVFVATGVQDLDYTKKVIDLGFDKVLLDTANGWTKTMMDFIYKLKKYNSKVQIMAGNVCTYMGYVDLVNAGADCVRVGIGNGSPCTTRIVTSVGYPQFSAIYECGKWAKKRKIPIISDGGIRNSRDMSLAIAAGATTIMVGKLLALTEESAAEKRGGMPTACTAEEPCKEILPLEARYRGQASKEYQIYNYGKVKEGTVPEGVGFWAPVTGSATEVISDLVSGLRSSMTYLGAKTIKEYQNKAEFAEVTPSYMIESNPRKD